MAEQENKMNEAEELKEEPVIPEEEQSEIRAEQTDAATEEQETEQEEKPSFKEKKKIKKLESELAETKAALVAKDGELAALNDQYLRICAEYDNFRKRSAKEREGIYADSCADVLTQILPILDNLERAAQYNTEDVAQTAVGKGLELVLKSFGETLGKLGVTEIEALGKPFDPNLHNAVMHVDDETYGENEVVEVLMKGYARGDKVLRYAMVKVAN